MIKKGKLVMAKMVWSWRRRFDGLVVNNFDVNLHFLCRVIFNKQIDVDKYDGNIARA